MPDFSEIDAQRQQATPDAADPVEDLRVLKQAALQMQSILASSEWETYRRTLEEWMAFTQRTIDQHAKALAIGDVVGDEATRVQLKLAYAYGLIDFGAAALGMPQAILDQDETLQKTISEKFFLTTKKSEA